MGARREAGATVREVTVWISGLPGSRSTRLPRAFNPMVGIPARPPSPAQSARIRSNRTRPRRNPLPSTPRLCGALSVADLAPICYLPSAGAMRISTKPFARLAAWTRRIRTVPAVAADHERLKSALAHGVDIASEFEGPDGRMHWRDSRLEWPVRHGFGDFVMREFKTGGMMFPPNVA